MKNITSVMLISTLSLNIACTSMKNTEPQQETIVDATLANNPFMTKSTLQYQAPEFDKIKDEHFKPAFDYGLKQNISEIEKIADNAEAPTFENTVLALEKSGEVLKRAQIVFYNLTGSNTNPTLQKVEEEYAPIFAAHNDKIYLNSKLFNRIKAVKTDGLDSEDKRLIEVYKQRFELAGANLTDAQKEQMKAINAELATLGTQFTSKLLEARKKGAVLINDVKELDGLSADEIAAAAKKTKKAGYEWKYILTLLNTTQQPILQNLKYRKKKKKLVPNIKKAMDKSFHCLSFIYFVYRLGKQFLVVAITSGNL